MSTSLQLFVREILREAKMRTLGDLVSGGAEDIELSSIFDKIRAAASTVAGEFSGGTGGRRPTTLRALIIGDSQVGSALGSELERRLTGLGYNVTRADAMVGKPSGVVVDAAIPKVSSYTVVFAIYGGNDTSADTAIANTQRLYDKCVEEGVLLVVIGPAPATRATSLDSVRRGWGSPSGAATDAEGAEITLDYQLTRSGGNYDEQRAEISDAIDSFGEDKSGIATYGIATQYQGYPDQPDGLHIFNGAPGIVEDIFEKLRIVDLTQDLKDELEATRYQALASDYTPSTDSETIANPAHYATIQLSDVPAVYTRKFEAGTTAYDDLIDAAGLRYGVSPAFIKAIMNVESNFSPTAASRAPNDKPGWGPDGTTLKEGDRMAVGLMQFIWPTGVSYGLCAGDGNGGVLKDDRTEPPAAIDAGARFIKNLWDKFGNWPQVAAAYNSGPGNVPGGKWTAFPETRNYVPNVMALYHAYGGEGYDVNDPIPLSDSLSRRAEASRQESEVSAGKKAYIVGDSQAVGVFGSALEENLTRKGYSVNKAAVGGSSARSWASGGPPFKGATVNLGTVQNQGPYDLGIICLGTNDAANAQVSADKTGTDIADHLTNFADNIETIARTLGARRTIWVGPPALNGTTPYYTAASVDELYAAASEIDLEMIDSSNILPDPRDGVHVGTQAKAWADTVSELV